MFLKHYLFINAYFKQALRKMSTENCKIAVCQFTATNVKAENLETVQRLVLQAAQNNAQMIFLPEGCDYIAGNKEEIHSLAETLSGPLITEYKALAKNCNVWLSIGGFHEILNGNDQQNNLSNSHIIVDDVGEIRAIYRKLHLFDVHLPEKNINLKESDYVSKGREIVAPIKSPAGPLGLLLCYDLRFPEISTILRKMGAVILTYPSAFTDKTGEAHWEVLLRSRAIENQCYVVAAAQYGCHNPKRTTFGQAMIVDPWGKIIAECPKYSSGSPTNECVVYANIDQNYIKQVRREMPVFEHRRDDMYKLITLNDNTDLFEIGSHYMFSNKVIPGSQVFYVTKYSYAFTNIRCVVPGHVLVASLRNAKRLNDLTPEEVADLFQTVVKVQHVIEKVHSASSSTICVQDGKHAGQTISHVHCHVLPRKANDFENNDEIYLKLAQHDKKQSPQPLRNTEEMSEEASVLRNYFIK